MSANAAGTIGICTTEQPRFTRFWTSLANLERPPCALRVVMDINLAKSRNEILRTALGDWVWFIDDDHEIPPGLLARLLAIDAPVVAPVVLSRAAPFQPVHMGPKSSSPEVPDGHYKFALLPGSGGQVEVEATGTAGMLIRREVWETIEPPWFTCGELRPDQLSEDIAFCRRVRKAGFKILVDLETPLPHLTSCALEPVRLEDGTWHTRVSVGGASFLTPQKLPPGGRQIWLPS